MKIKFYFTLLIILTANSAMACLHASQKKIFPVGTKDGLIYCIEYKLERIENYNIKKRFKLNVSEENPERMEPFWLIYGAVSVYNQEQKLIQSIPVDSSYIASGKYNDSLTKSYDRLLAYTKAQYPDLELFTPDYFSFCDYQLICERVSMDFDTTNHKNIVRYKNHDYITSYFTDSTNFNPQVNPFYWEQITNLRINSVRIYKNKDIELVMIHLAFGDYIYNYTSDPELIGKPNEDGLEYVLSKEHKPDFKFKSIENGSFEEPVLHHGYGFDLFISVRK